MVADRWHMLTHNCVARVSGPAHFPFIISLVHEKMKCYCTHLCFDLDTVGLMLQSLACLFQTFSLSRGLAFCRSIILVVDLPLRLHPGQSSINMESSSTTTVISIALLFLIDSRVANLLSFLITSALITNSPASFRFGLRGSRL